MSTSNASARSTAPLVQPAAGHVVLHLRVDNFLEQAECLRNPSLSGHPLILGGLPEEEGPVTAVSRQLRRWNVVGTTLRTTHARLPRALFIPADPRLYVHVARQVMHALGRWEPRAEIEWWELGSFFLSWPAGAGLAAARSSAARSANASTADSRPATDRPTTDRPATDRLATDRPATRRSMIERARELVDHLLQEQGVFARVGMGPNRLVARLASTMAARPDEAGETVVHLSRREFEEVFASKPLAALESLGAGTQRALRGFGMTTIGDLAQTRRDALTKAFGSMAHLWIDQARGIDASHLIPWDAPDRVEGSSCRIMRAHREFAPPTRRQGVVAKQLEACAAALANRLEMLASLPMDSAATTTRSSEPSARTGPSAYWIELRIEWNDGAGIRARAAVQSSRPPAERIQVLARALWRRFETGGYVRSLELRLGASRAVRPIAEPPRAEPARAEPPRAEQPRAEPCRNASSARVRSRATDSRPARAPLPRTENVAQQIVEKP